MFKLGLNFLNLGLTKTNVFLNLGLKRFVIRAYKFWTSTRFNAIYLSNFYTIKLFDCDSEIERNKSKISSSIKDT